VKPASLLARGRAGGPGGLRRVSEGSGVVCLTRNTGKMKRQSRRTGTPLSWEQSGLGSEARGNNGRGSEKGR
jgi:hypothetical protein